MRVLIYARVSTDEQAKVNLSLDYQLQQMRHYCERQGWHIYSEVREDFTGREIERPYMDSIREIAKKHEFDAILVLRVDRLAREQGFCRFRV